MAEPAGVIRLLPLCRDDLARDIEGTGCARRMPILVHTWIDPDTPVAGLEALFDEALHYGTSVVEAGRAPAKHGRSAGGSRR